MNNSSSMLAYLATSGQASQKQGRQAAYIVIVTFRYEVKFWAATCQMEKYIPNPLAS